MAWNQVLLLNRDPNYHNGNVVIFEVKISEKIIDGVVQVYRPDNIKGLIIDTG